MGFSAQIAISSIIELHTNVKTGKGGFNMKSISKLIIGFAIMVSMVVFSPMSSQALAMSPVFGHKYINGIGHIAIYIDGSTYPRASYWEPRIVDAVNNWMYTGYGDNPFYGVYVSSTYGSNMDIYAVNESYFDSLPSTDNMYRVAGVTVRYGTDGIPVDPRYNDWFFAEIRFNHDLFSETLFPNEQANAVLAHEMGHAFGLDENPGNSYSIMFPKIDGCNVVKVQKVDNDALNSIY